MDDPQEKLSFITIIKEGLNTEHMRIPPKFLKYLDIYFSSNAILIGPSGDQWQVTIFKKGNDIYMQHGWTQFLTDNLVMVGEFLLFTYDGENCFRVQIFSKNGCERLLFIKRRQVEAATPSLARTKKGRPRKTSAESLYLHEWKTCQEELPLSNKGSLPKDYVSKPQISTEIERSNVCELAESFTSNNPYLKRLMTKSSVEKGFLLPIATKFARKHLPQEVKAIILQNSEGKSWEVTCLHSQNQRYTWFSKGWATFVRDNKLKRGDTCIFELLGKNHMRVHIFRCAPN